MKSISEELWEFTRPALDSGSRDVDLVFLARHDTSSSWLAHEWSLRT